MGTTSDQAGLLINLSRIERGSTPFKFFNSWLRDDKFNEEFRAAWVKPMEGSPLYALQQKINAVRHMGKKWAKKLMMMNRISRTIDAEL